MKQVLALSALCKRGEGGPEKSQESWLDNTSSSLPSIRPFTQEILIKYQVSTVTLTIMDDLY